MNMIKHQLKKIIIKNDWAIPQFIFLLTGFLLLPFFRFSQGGDVVSYLSIADKYIEGNLFDAINGVWSPLLSWLMIPFIYLDTDRLITFRLINFIATIPIFYYLAKLLSDLGISILRWRMITLIGLIPLLHYYALFLCTPDLLVASLLLIYFYHLSPNKYLNSVSKGFVSGIFGGLSFLAKAYSLPFFLFHFTVLNTIYYLRQPNRRKVIFKNYILGFCGFILISGVWIILLSSKYGHFTYSTAGQYNFNIVGPAYNNNQLFRNDSLLPPPNESAVSYWEDPSFIKLENWNPFGSEEELNHFISLILKNSIKIIFLILIISPLFLFVLVLNKNLFIDSTSIIILITIIIYLAGYSMLFIDERFLIFPVLLIVIITYKSLIDLSNKFKFSNRGLIIALCICSFSISIKPVYSLAKYSGEGIDLHRIIKSLKYHSIKGNLAGISEIPLGEDWKNLIYLAYNIDSKFFGELNIDKGLSKIVEELRAFDIDYIFDWSETEIFENDRNFELVKEDFIITEPLNFKLINEIRDNLFNIFNIGREIRKNKNLKVYKVKYL